jgi:hypothetical protein
VTHWGPGPPIRWGQPGRLSWPRRVAEPVGDVHAPVALSEPVTAGRPPANGGWAIVAIFCARHLAEDRQVPAVTIQGGDAVCAECFQPPAGTGEPA